MTSYISSAFSCAYSSVQSVYQHVKQHKVKYLAACATVGLAVILGRRGFAVTEMEKMNQERVNTWCEAFHFEQAAPLSGLLGATTQKVDSAFLARVSSGEIAQLCSDPYSEIWTNPEAQMQFNKPGSNKVPDLSFFKGEQLSTLKALETQGLLSLSPYSQAGKEAFYQLTDADAIRYFVNQGHDLNLKDRSGESLLMKVVGQGRALRKDFVPLLQTLIEEGVNLNPMISLNGRSPLARLMSMYTVEDGPQDPMNIRVLQAAELLVENGARVTAEDFYSVNKRDDGYIESVKENSKLLKTLRRLVKLNPKILTTMLSGGLDVTAKVPSNFFSTPIGSKINSYDTQRLYFTLLRNLGVNDFYFKKTSRPSELQQLVTENLRECAVALKSQHYPWTLRGLRYDHNGRELNLLEFIELHDHSPDKTLVQVFKPVFE